MGRQLTNIAAQGIDSVLIFYMKVIVSKVINIVLQRDYL